MKHLLITILTIICPVLLNAGEWFVETNEVLEWEYISEKDYQDPFNEVDLVAEITGPSGNAIRLPAFWAGGNIWKFRFSAPVEGSYVFHTICNDRKNSALHKQKGLIRITPYTGRNMLLKKGSIQISADRTYLEHQDGTPFFWLADSWWHGMTTRFSWPDDFKTLTLDRKNKGFSVIQFAVAFPCDIYPFDERGQNEAGDPWDSSWNCINPAYFDLTDKRIQYLVSQGLVPNIVGAWGYYIKWAGVEGMQKHWKYLIARYGAYPVTWTLAGEVTLAWYHDLATQWEQEKTIFREEWSEVASFIKEQDPFVHLLTVHPGPNSGDLHPIKNMEHIDMFMCQSGHEGYYTFERSIHFVKKAMEMYPDKPVIHGEVCFEGMDGKSWNDVQRFLFWSNILMGTPGYSYGAEGIWQFNTKDQLFGASPAGNVWGNVPWDVASQYRGSGQIGLGKKFIEKFEWWKLEPAQDRIECNTSDPVSVPFCAVIDERDLFIYMFRKPARWRPYKVNGLIPEKEYGVTWFDPITGQVHSGDRFRSDSEGKLDINRLPIMQDWVLVIHMKS